MRLTDILERLSGVEEDHDGYLALCPAHADRVHPSLKLTLKAGGKLLVVCRAGCVTADILTKLRLSPSDLFDVDGQGAKTVSATAPEAVGVAEIAGLRMFVDETSSALHADDAEAARVYLFDRFGLTPDLAADLNVGYSATGPRPQTWLSRSFTRYPRVTVPLTGFDGVVRGLQGRDISKRCPARWVSLTNPVGRQWAKWGVLRSGAGFNTVLVCEGPGDALTAVAAGYDAVAIRGAGLARNASLVAELAAGLRDLDVVIAGDRDRAGAGFTDSLAGALVRAGVMVRRLEIPHDGDDLTDWRGRDAEAFPGLLHSAVRAAEVVTADEPAPSPPSSPPAIAGVADLEIPADARAAFDMTDVGIATRLRDFLHGGVRWASGLGFLVWNGRYWEPGQKQVRHAIHLMGAKLLETGRDYDRKLAMRALTTRSITDVLAELPSVPGVAVEADAFDRTPDVLSVANGTIDLRTGTLRPHDPDDLITQCLDIEYSPDAEAPFWLQFLSSCFPHHPEMPDYLRRVNGYGITGHTSENMFIFHHGGGQNGKSVYTDNLRIVFRGIARSTEFTTFEARTSVGQASPEVAGLRGYRMVMASETEKYSRLAESLIKQLTGGDAVTARFLNQNPFTFTPRFLLQVAGNYKPAILSQDHGIWRRVKLIPWEAKFTGADCIPRHVMDARIQAEAEGILAWAVRGAMEWYADGLGEPDTVSTTTQDYRESEDRLAEFIAARLVAEEGATVAPMELRRAYAEWAEDAGLSRKETLSGWALGVEMESRGYPKRKSRRWAFVGIRLATDAERESVRRLTEQSDSEPNTQTDIFGQPKEVAA